MYRGGTKMPLILAAVSLAILCIFAALWIKRTRAQKEWEQYSITPEDLHALLASKQEILLYDVRQPLDLLATSEIIPGATRIPPQDVLDNPDLIPKQKDSIVYCTCPSDETSQAISRQAVAMGFFKVKFLKGGLEAWKAKGYPVEPYEKPFHLDSGS
jgi:rhodanese-related sulfurtransferase